MKDCIKQEMMYAVKRYYVPVITIMFLLIIILSLRSNYDKTTEYMESYLSVKEDYILEGIDWYEEMNKEYSVEIEENGASSFVATDNQIAYEADCAREALYAISPEFSITFILESLMTLGFVVIMMLAVVIATYDNKNYTIRIKSTQYSKVQIFIAKQVVLLAIIVISSFISVVVSYIGNRVYYNGYMKNITAVDELGKVKFIAHSNLLVKVAVFFALMIFVAELGYAIGVILKSGLTAMIAVIIFNLFASHLPKQLRITDSTSKVMQSVFEYHGDVITPSYTAINTVTEAVVLMAVQLICFIGISCFIFNKRSAYK